MRSPGHFSNRFFIFWKATVGQRLSTTLGWIAVIYLSVTMLFQFDQDTTDVSGAAFVVASILAGLAFTYAGVLPDGDKDRDDVTHSGERLCQGALLFLMGSLLKYGTMALPAQLAALPLMAHANPESRSSVEFLVLMLQVFLFLVFMGAILVSQLGYTILGRVLTRRMSRRGKDVYFPPQQQSD